MSDEKKPWLVCKGSPDGKHVPDPRSGMQTNDDFVVDFECIHCNWTGSVKIDPAEINWD